MSRKPPACGLEYFAKKAEGTKKLKKRLALRSQRLSEVDRRLANLNQMRLKDLLNDEEYIAEKKCILKEKTALQHALGDNQDGVNSTLSRQGRP